MPHPEHDQEQARSVDRKGGPGHTVLLALALAVPALKIAYTVGGREHVRDVIVGMEPANWPDVLLGMVLTEPLLGCVFAVVVSRVVFALFAARGAVPKRSGFVHTLRRLALTVVNPLAVGVIAACCYGVWWGLGTGLLAFALREGVVVEYRTGRRGRRHHDSDYEPPGWLRRAARYEQWVAAALTVVVLPLLAVGVAVDGRAWTSVLECQVQDGTETSEQRIIELGRKGSGVVGWSLDREEVVNGVGCTETGSLRVRAAWWSAGD
ncbi:hypothetical protein [Streptomyces lancefieldiae]|uniref:RDD domain-containing protein n=1 Tax=Streptomyces lancefieldiae TaxID=3075520 RepID=A0ABU3AFW8_9ACTN|nr:hypothetical protein [Streptomyces sp. DSM 40712]MDT0609067.1 hypothetical protein [Streptomyces sp. DSM 40712]